MSKAETALRCDRCGIVFEPHGDHEVDFLVHGRVLTGDACVQCAQTIWGAIENLLPKAPRSRP